MRLNILPAQMLPFAFDSTECPWALQLWTKSTSSSLHIRCGYSFRPTAMPVHGKVLFVLVEPLVILRNVTVPVSADPEEWNSYRMVVNVAMSPMFICWAMGVCPPFPTPSLRLLAGYGCWVCAPFPPPPRLLAGRWVLGVCNRHIREGDPSGCVVAVLAFGQNDCGESMFVWPNKALIGTKEAMFLIQTGLPNDQASGHQWPDQFLLALRRGLRWQWP